MKTRDRIRQWLQNFLGILSLEKTQQRRHNELSAQITGFEQRVSDWATSATSVGNLVFEDTHQMRIELCDGLRESALQSSTKHQELLLLISTQNERLLKLENMFVGQHVATRRTDAPSYDWEQVQNQELAKMLMDKPEDS